MNTAYAKTWIDDFGNEYTRGLAGLLFIYADPEVCEWANS